MNALRRLLAGLLLAMGFVIAGTCGLCTGFFVVASLIAASRGQNTDFATTGPFMAIGAVATAIGVGLGWAGIALMRDRPPEEPPQPPR